MEEAVWNFQTLSISTFRMTQISIAPPLTTRKLHFGKLPLLVLSHDIAYRGTPALFLKKSPTYSPVAVASPLVLVFDYTGTFISDNLSSKRFAVESWSLDFSEFSSDEFLDHFQRAFTLASLYRLQDYTPLYFTTFLVISTTEFDSEPCLFQPVPVCCNSAISIRRVVQGGLAAIPDSTRPVPLGSFILIPPFEHPFTLVERMGTSIGALYVDNIVRNFPLKTLSCVHLTSPSPVMPFFFAPPPPRPVSEILRATNTCDRMNVSPAALEAFFTRRAADPVPPAGESHAEEEDEKECEGPWGEEIEPRRPPLPDPSIGLAERFGVTPPDAAVAVAVPAKRTAAEVAHQQLSDPAARRAICRTLSAAHPFPKTRSTLRLPSATPVSPFRFDFGFASFTLPLACNVHELWAHSPCNYQRLGFPEVLVNWGGEPRTVPVSTICAEWEEKKLLPILGPKNAFFVVFCVQNLRHEDVSAFFRALRHAYRMLEFGHLTPMPRAIEPAYFPEGLIKHNVNQFFANSGLGKFAEFREPPILTFIVGPPITDRRFNPPSIVTYLPPSFVAAPNATQLRALAFVVFSKIRRMAPAPLGHCDIEMSPAAKLFFEFRYEPPFLLRRPEIAAMAMHIAWDVEHSATAWMDDIGSVLKVMPNSDLKMIVGLSRDLLTRFHSPPIKITLTILGEGITEELFMAIMSGFAENFNELSVFAVSPAPAVQVRFIERFDDDALIRAPREQCRPFLYRLPIETGYVVSQHQPAYSCSVYNEAGWPLEVYAAKMSGLSWLSVKPGSENRTISYPPHIFALLSTTEPETLTLSRFEFLPSTECF
jgi:hypothetical protein